MSSTRQTGGLKAGGGVCGAIFTAAGYDALAAACERIGGCPEGSAVITPGFAMKAKYIIHAVGPKWAGGFSGEREKLYSCYQAALRLAQENGCRSIGFPLLSAGIFQYPLEEAWETAIRSIRDYFRDNPDCGLRVEFAVRDGEKAAAGQRILDSVREPEEKGEDTSSRPLQKRIRIYTSEAGQYRRSEAYTYIAEFADPRTADHYIRYMRGKKRYAHKDIIVREMIWKETKDGKEEVTPGNIVSVISVLGECIPPEEIDL